MTKLEIKTNWTKGEIVSVPRKISQIKSGLESHMHFVSSHYVCIREEDAEQCGILVVLHIIRNDQLLIDTLEKSSMHINPNSTFWVRDTARSRLVLKKPQYYDVLSGKLLTASGVGRVHYRLSIIYFRQSQLISQLM